MHIVAAAPQSITTIRTAAVAARRGSRIRYRVTIARVRARRK
jgi:hypothetical protein